MKSSALAHFLLRRAAPAFALALPALAMAQANAPARSARLDLIEGSVVASRAGDNEWADVQTGRTLAQGDRLWTDRGGHSGLSLGNASLRMNGQTRVDIHALQPNAAQVVVMQGSLNARLRSLAAQENFEIDTPNLAFRASQPGEYRVDVDTSRGTTRVTVISGSGVVYGENGSPLPVTANKQIVFSGRALAQASVKQSPQADSFDRWLTGRDQQVARQSAAAAAASREPVQAAPQEPVQHAQVAAQVIAQVVPQPLPQVMQQSVPQTMPPQWISQPAPQVVSVMPAYPVVYPHPYAYTPWPRSVSWAPVWYPRPVVVNRWAPHYPQGRWVNREQRHQGHRHGG
ncbi:MAG: FecR domain-containing protein [Burkholderiales bacterium]|nr:FecR domain-containing protein [Burkholderiales bacterium]